MVRIEIQWDERTGQYAARASTSNQVWLLGLLELAKAQFSAQKVEEKRIIPAGAIPNIRSDS